MSTRELYAIYGASGFGREVLPVARSTLQQILPHDGYELVFVDDERCSASVNGHRALTYAEFLGAPAAAKHVNVAIASAATRRMLFERCARDSIAPFDIRASNAVLLDDLMMGPGSILCPFVTLTSNIRIGRGFHANIYSYVAHDCVIGDYVTFAPAVKCNGNVVIEDEAYLGTGCVLRQGQPGAPLVIGARAVVGMGAVVTRSVPPDTTVIGNPARVLQKER
jgi:sugar O-acyltransferase (sialic acid O-acetyltransferase NeuD family)